MVLNIKKRGFTLIELLVVIVLFGMMSGFTVSIYSQLTQHQRAVYEETAFEKNRAVALGILKHANETNGRLPAPYSGTMNGVVYASAPVNPDGTGATSVAIKNNIQSYGIPVGHITNDGSAASNVRVYQRVQGITIDLPIRGISGDTVSITYDVGVVYQTQCAAPDSCNTGTPGSSPVMTSANYTTWDLTGTDIMDFSISTLDHQKKLLDITMDSISKLILRIQNEFAYRSITAAPNDTTNFYFAPNGTGAPNLSVVSAATNDGCYDGWYNLTASNVNVVERYGLNKSTYATTAWGGVIQYCRDFDPVNAGKEQIPHSAAIRFNRNVTSAAAPAAGQNIVIAF